MEKVPENVEKQLEKDNNVKEVITTQPTSLKSSIKQFSDTQDKTNNLLNEKWAASPPIPDSADGDTLSDFACLKNLNLVTINLERNPELGWTWKNRFEIRNNNGELIYKAIELSCVSMPNTTLGNNYMEIRNEIGKSVITSYRVSSCGSCCLPFNSDIMRLYTLHGEKLGSIMLAFSFCKPKFKIKDAAENVLFRIYGSSCSNCGTDINFKIYASNGKFIGKISKSLARYSQENTNHVPLIITFPLELDVNHKAILMSATFLINHKYYKISEDRSGYAQAPNNDGWGDGLAIAMAMSVPNESTMHSNADSDCCCCGDCDCDCGVCDCACGEGGGDCGDCDAGCLS